MKWILEPIIIKNNSINKDDKVVEFYNYRIEFSELKINSINDIDKILRAIIYKDGYMTEIKIAFNEKDLHLQVNNFFKQLLTFKS